MSPFYRKKPMTVEARQTGQGYDEDCAILEWCKGRFPVDLPSDWLFAIDTLEGPHLVTSGDWIVKGYQDEFWPIKPDIFAATYELVEPEVTAIDDPWASYPGGWEGWMRDNGRADDI